MRRFILITSWILLCVLHNVSAQHPLRIQVQVNKPYPNKISDFQSNPSQVVVLITNTTQTPYSVQLLGAVTGDNGVRVATPASHRSIRAVEVGPLSVTRVSADDIGALFNPNNLLFGGISREQAVRMNGVPEGIYQVCVRAVDFATRAPLSDEEPIGCSNIFMVSSLEPPVLIKPFDDETIEVRLPQNLVFTWSLPPGAPPATQYTLRMVEVPEGRNAFDIMRSSRQPFFETIVTGAPTFLYGPSAPALVPGRRYALMVMAADPFGNAVFRNGGRSEVIAFRFGGTSDEGAVAGAGKRPGRRSINVPRSVISGKVEWRFRKTEEQDLVLNVSTPLLFAESPQLLQAMQDPSYGTITTAQANQVSATTISSMVLAQPPNSSPTQSVVASPASILSTTNTPFAVIGGGGNTKSVVSGPIASANQYADMLENIDVYGSSIHSLKRTRLRVYAVNGAGASSLVGATETDDDGKFEVSFINTAFYNASLGSEIRIDIDHPDFRVQQKSLRLPKADSTGRFDVGTVKALARNFRFRPTVVDEAGKPFDDARVEIYRPVSYYDRDPNMRPEGSALSGAPVGVNGQQCVRVATVRSGREASKLFYSDEWTDHYIVKVVHPKLVPVTTRLTVSPTGNARDEVLIVSREYKTMLKMPTLKGKIEKNTTPILPGSGAIVTLHFNDDADFGPKQNTTIESLGINYFNAANALVNATASPSGPVQQNVSPQSTQPQQGLMVTQTSAIASNILPAINPPQQHANAFVVGAAPTSLVAAAILANTRSTTADSAGNFYFTNLPTSNSPTKMTVRLPGSDNTYDFEVEIKERGIDYDMGDVTINMAIFTITGKVTDESGNPIPTPRISWASGGTIRDGDSFGRFSVTNTAGNDTLVITKLGFETKRVPVSLREPKSTASNNQKAGESFYVSPAIWGSMIQQSPSLQPASSSPEFSAASLGYHTVTGTHITAAPAPTPVSGRQRKREATMDISNAVLVAELQPLYDALFTPEEKVTAPVDLGTIKLRKKIGRLLVRVKDAGKSPLKEINIKVLDTELTGSTADNGTWYSEVPGGEITVEATGDISRNLVAVRRQILTAELDTTYLDITMTSGVVISGVVTAGNTPIGEARIQVDGLDHINTLSNATGQYRVVVPKGDYTLRATRTGYIGARHQQVFSGNAATVNFKLGSVEFNINTILGFDVEITAMQGSGNSRTISGALVNLPSNSLFTAKSGTRLPFDQVAVNIVDNALVPKNGELPLSVTALEMLALSYLPVVVKNNNQALVVRQEAGNTHAGYLIGVPEIRYDKFIPIPLGVSIPADANHTLIMPGTTGPLTVLRSGDAPALPEELQLLAGNSKASLYGFDFTIQPQETVIRNDGLRFGGAIKLTGVPLLENTSLRVDELHIGTDGAIRNVAIALGAEQQFTMAQWQATMRSVNINENGIKLSGNISVKVPQSRESAIDFSNLSVSKGALYGGDFVLPSSGIDIFNIVSMKRGPRALSFGRIGNGNVYYIGGSGVFDLPKFINKSLTVEFFQVQTDGNFEARVPANFSVDFLSIAKLSIRSIGFRTIGGVGIDVKGDFNLSGIPFFKASAGGIQYGRNGSVSVEELGIGFDMIGIARMEARAKFIDNAERKGFEGEGHIQIKGTPLDLGLRFKYFKLPNGIEVGGLLRAGVVVPIGIVSLAEIEGEFNLNTQDNKWMGRIGGSLSIGGLNYAVAVRPLSITVENGPVFRLKGGLSVLQQTIATAEGILDFPKSYFSFTFRQDLSFLPELITVGGSGALILSTAEHNTYWLMASRFHASMLGGLVKGNANVTVGWGLKVDAHPEYAEYTSFINRNYLDNGTLKGVHVATYAGINFDTGHRSFAGIASGRAWYNNFGDVRMDMGFGAGNYGFSVAAGWEAGAYLRIADIDVAGIIAGIEGGLSGYYTHATHDLSFQGYLRAKLIAWIGSCSSACANKICWGGCFNACILGCEICPIPVGGKLCLQPGVRASYQSGSGFKMGIDF